MAHDITQLKGSIAPVVTPFDQNSEVDHAVLRRLIEWQIQEGSHGISVTGTTGEPSSLRLQERMEIFKTTVDAVAGRVPVMLATGSNNLEETIELTHQAETLGADAALVIVPYYNRPSQEGLYHYFLEVAGSTTLPIVLYNIPGRTAVNLEPATMKRIRLKAENVVGVKEANRDFEQVSMVLSVVGRDFLVYSGIEALCYPMLMLGGAGHISATANLMPKAVANLYNWVRDGKYDEALDLHYRLLPLNQALFWETNPGPVKAAMALMDLIHPGVRLPLQLPGAELQGRLAQVLSEYGLVNGREAL